MFTDYSLTLIAYTDSTELVREAAQHNLATAANKDANKGESLTTTLNNLLMKVWAARSTTAKTTVTAAPKARLSTTTGEFFPVNFEDFLL